MDNNIVMDTYYEQIVPIKKTSKVWALFFGIWLLAFVLISFIFFTNLLGSINLILYFGIIYGAYWLSTKLNVEFEYIITNGTMDIDKIINKSSRKRIATFELSNTARLEKFNPNAINGLDRKSVIYACNEDDENAYFMVAGKLNGGTVNLVFAPNDKTRSAIAKFAPKFLTNSAFNN